MSELDVQILADIRDNVVRFMRCAAASYASDHGRLLDVAPQDHEGAAPFFPGGIHIDTFDIDPWSGTTFVGDICRKNECFEDGVYDYVVCTEVLEHTRQPFDAIEEIFRILRPGGYLFLTTPFNFRIHGPLPDCWRFTEHGLRELLKRFQVVELNQVESRDRALMPIHYSIVAQKPIHPENGDLYGKV